jgi:hypothetical protein
MLHVFVRQFAKAREDHHEVSTFKRRKTRDIVVAIGIDGASYRIDGEEHGAFESMMSRQQLGEHTHTFFGPIVFFARDKDDVLPFSDSL